MRVAGTVVGGKVEVSAPWPENANVVVSLATTPAQRVAGVVFAGWVLIETTWLSGASVWVELETPEEVMIRLAPVIRARCRLIMKEAHVSSREHPEMLEDLELEVYEKYLQAVRDGWFNQPAWKNLEAQARTKLVYIYLQVETAFFDHVGRARKETDMDVGDEQEALPGPAANVDSGEVPPDEALLRKEASARFEKVFPKLTNPAQRLVVAGFHFPHKLSLRLVEEVDEYVPAGRRFLVRRPPEEVWRLLEQAVSDTILGADDAAWRRRFAEILKFDVSLGEADPEQVRLAVNGLEAHQKRAFAVLRGMLGGLQ